MSAIKQEVKNLVAGISQQPTVLRFPEQLDLQKNAMSSSPTGLIKRPPTTFVAELEGFTMHPSIDSKPLIHVIERDDFEKYIVSFNGNGVQVWDYLGNHKTVTFGVPADQIYLTTSKPREDLKNVSVADYTFTANGNIKTKMSTELTSNQWETQGVLFHVKSGQYGRTYECYINGVQKARFTTPNGSDPADALKIDTNYISNQLKAGLETNGYTCVAGNGWVYATSSTPITTASTKDGFNNQALYCFLHATQSFSNLPATAPSGFTVLVKGSNSSGADDYYVRFDTTDNLWKETSRPKILKGFDKSTMPHALVRNADGTFTFSTAEWTDREIGDEDSNPVPSFIGSAIRDLFFVRNRLGFLSNENVIMSNSGEFFKYWMTTATDILDSDVIDEAVPDESVTLLRHAVVFNEELLVFSPHAQFIGRSDTIFSPKNFRLDRTTRFNCLSNCKPVSAGRRVYFANARAEYSSLMEYYIVEDVTGVKDAQDISNHVPEFIGNTVHGIIGNTSENLLLLLTTGDPSRIYVYKYLWQEERRVQASWSYWDFGSGEILGGGFLGTDLYLVIKRGAKVFLEKMTFTYNTLDFPEAEPYRAFMDRKIIYTVPAGAYNTLTGYTSINPQLVYPGGLPHGYTYGIITQDGIYSEFDGDTNTVLFTGNLEGQKVVVGELLHWKCTLSELMVREDDGKGGIKARTDGRLQIREISFNYARSGFFKIYVEHKGKRTFCYDMTARTLGKLENTLGSLPIGTGTFTVPVHGDSRDVVITIESSTPNAVSIIGYNWLGNYVERSGK